MELLFSKAYILSADQSKCFHFIFEYYPTSHEEYYFDEHDAKQREPFKHFLLQFPGIRSAILKNRSLSTSGIEWKSKIILRGEQN